MIFLRIFFEGIMEAAHSVGYSKFSYRAILMYFVHFPLFYLTTFLTVTIIISLFLQEKITRVTKIATPGLGLIILVPVIDAICGGGCFITYPSRLESYFLHFLNPVVSLVDIGVSTGQRIVIFLICLLIALYTYIKTANFLKTLLLFFVVYLTILFFGGLTTIIAGNNPESIYIIGGMLKTDTQKFSAIYALLFLIVSLLYFYLLDKKNFRLLITSMRAERMVFYGGLGIAGLILAQHQSGLFYKIDFFNFLATLFVFFSPGFNFWVVQILNDFFDVQSDKFSRPRNPFLKGIKKSYYITTGVFLSLFVLIISSILNYQSFLIMLTFLLLGVLYSVPPVRLKRIPLVSTFILAIAVILSISLGYSLIFYEKAFQRIPVSLIYAILSGVTLGFSAKDINDVEADKRNGIITLPVLFYRNDNTFGRLPFSLMVSSSYLFFGIFFHSIFFGAIICSIITFCYTLFSTKPREWIYFMFLYFFSIYLLFSLIL